MSEQTSTVLIVETTAGDPPLDFLGQTSDLVYFISMAHSERYGMDHPLAKAAAVLKRKLRVNLGPLMHYGDAQPDDEAEAAMLERLWQDAAPLEAAARAAAEAIASTPELRELTADFPELPDRLRELADMAAWAVEQGAKVRLTYVI